MRTFHLEAEQRPERGGNAGNSVATPDNEKKESNNMANYYEQMLKRKVMVKDLLVQAFEKKHGVSLESFKKLSAEVADDGLIAEIRTVQDDIDYYKGKVEAEKAATEEAPTEEGEENG